MTKRKANSVKGSRRWMKYGKTNPPDYFKAKWLERKKAKENPA